MKKTAIVISKKVKVPRVNTFKAAAIDTSDNKPAFRVTKKIDHLSAVARFLEHQLRDTVISS